MVQENKATNDLKVIAAYVTGVITFAATVTTFFVKVLNAPLELTTGIVAVLSSMLLLTTLLINRAERRMYSEVQRVKEECNATQQKYDKDMTWLKNMALENARSSLRTEMDNEIHRRPDNHDTIIKYAYRYFIELDSDWVETEKFEAWIDSEEKAGRKVHLPRELLANITHKAEIDRAGGLNVM